MPSPPADRARRPRHHLGGLERDSRRDDATGAACLRGDFAAARAIQRTYLPLMNVNFVESNPIPVKAAMALMGLLEPVYRLPMVPARAART